MDFDTKQSFKLEASIWGWREAGHGDHCGKSIYRCTPKCLLLLNRNDNWEILVEDEVLLLEWSLKEALVGNMDTGRIWRSHCAAQGSWAGCEDGDPPWKEGAAKFSRFCKLESLKSLFIYYCIISFIFICRKHSVIFLSQISNLCCWSPGNAGFNGSSQLNLLVTQNEKYSNNRLLVLL